MRGHFEASIEELKERHKLELQEGGTRYISNTGRTSINNINIQLIRSYPAAHGEHQQRQEPDGERVEAALAAAAEGLRGGGARARPRDRAAAGGL